MYSAYLHDQTLIKPLFKIAKASILDFPLSSLSVILEITKTHPNLVHQIQGLLLSLMKCCDSLCYYKLCQIFINTLELDATIVDKLRTILSDPLFQDSDHLIPSILLLSKLPDSQALINVYGKTLENSINSSQNPNEYYSIITAFSALKGKYTPSDPDCLKLLTSSSDNFIRVLALEQLDLPLSTLRTTVGSLISDKTVITSPILLEQVLNIAPQVGSWYITLLFNIHDMKIPGTNSILRSTLKTVTDRLTKELFISEVRIYLQELPDDDFGIGLAEMIAEDSDQFKDIYSLVPLNIASRSIEFQVAALDLTFEFVIRMQNQIKNGIVNRLENLCFSHSRKVRQRASELIFIINELQTSVSN
ncbi:hypothetical protein GPJ56_004271 [Histomonas meleagridis]|uniref:uncharacterized protein n=1 Tax=Histomonas meleagridis TaxID=135588 RepID=UPI003559DC98|nr:hypothetical protein GPJ56_004271 [Histomonas meleagridis]KAH0800515.1 hypothetical protein GO595_006718 [Histomonas meleagridis]